MATGSCDRQIFGVRVKILNYRPAAICKLERIFTLAPNMLILNSLPAPVANQEKRETDEGTARPSDWTMRFNQGADYVIRADVDPGLHGLFLRAVDDQVIFLVFELAELKLDVRQFAAYSHRINSSSGDPVFWA